MNCLVICRSICFSISCIIQDLRLKITFYLDKDLKIVASLVYNLHVAVRDLGGY